MSLKSEVSWNVTCELVNKIQVRIVFFQVFWILVIHWSSTCLKWFLDVCNCHVLGHCHIRNLVEITQPNPKNTIWLHSNLNVVCRYNISAYTQEKKGRWKPINLTRMHHGYIKNSWDDQWRGLYHLACVWKRQESATPVKSCCQFWTGRV